MKKVCLILALAAIVLVSLAFLIAFPIDDRYSKPHGSGSFDNGGENADDGKPIENKTSPANSQLPKEGAVYTYINSPENGKIAVRIDLPEEPRYEDSAPIVVVASTWFVEKYNKDETDFHLVYNPTDIGAITITHLWPGKSNPESGYSSEGTYDYGGPDSLAALRDTIKFALGKKTNSEGKYLNDLVAVDALYENVGMFASSHAGVVATNVMAYYGEELDGLEYFVGRENPTMAEMYPLEIGHWDNKHNAVQNPYYDPEGYTPTSIDVNYSTLGWIENAGLPDGRPYHAVPNGKDYVLDDKGPTIGEKRYFSYPLTKALFDNGAFALETWPGDVGKPEEVKDFWEYRETVGNYEKIGEKLPGLKVMLTFASNDHVQTAPDKPHIRQAYDGFRKGAGLWTRLNMDLSYVKSEINQEASSPDFPDNPANTEPEDWEQEAESWGFAGKLAGEMTARTVPLAGIAEMADRVKEGDWSVDLSEDLYTTTGEDKLGSVTMNKAGSFEGYTLIAPLESKKTVLINNDGDIINSWFSDYAPGDAAYLLEEGRLLRTAELEDADFGAGGTGGRVELFSFGGELLWFFEYSDEEYLAHHDVEMMPNGNLLMIAWERKSKEECTSSGAKPELAKRGLWPEHIIEVTPSKEVVWEWHVWDHLVQDYDPGKNNYGDVSAHPEKIDLNYRDGMDNEDWNHINSIDYNPESDHILLSSRQFDEIWIIDHNTTSAEAEGQRGDLLFRWGNPDAYGANGEQKLFKQHDAHWIGDTLPGAGNILLFNNGEGRRPPYSTVDELMVSKDYRSANSTIGWTYVLPRELYSRKISGAQRLPNGNTLICSGANGALLEVNRAGDIVWKYQLNPNSVGEKNIFRAYRYPLEIVEI
jgi:hypothetical protein